MSDLAAHLHNIAFTWAVCSSASNRAKSPLRMLPQASSRDIVVSDVPLKSGPFGARFTAA